MPTAHTHVVAALAIGAGFYRPGVPRNFLVTGGLLAALPDLDVIGFRFGIQYSDLLGHRGLTHSLAFALALAAAVVSTGFYRGAGPLGPRTVWAFLALAIASHGFLDAFTDGGLGIAFLAPFDSSRYFWPVRPIAVAPIGLHGLLQPRMLRVIETEILWVWCPSLILGLALVARSRRRHPPIAGI